MSNSLRPHESQHARPPCPSPAPVHPNSCASSRWCHPAISSSVIPFSSCPQSLPASESFPMSQLFAWGGQRIGVSALASVLPMNTQDWSPSEWTGWISLQSKGLSRVFSNTTVQKHWFFGAQLSSQSNSHFRFHLSEWYTGWKLLSVWALVTCVFSFLLVFIYYLVALGLSYGMWDLQYLLQHVRAFIVSCGISSQGLNLGPCIGSRES